MYIYMHVHLDVLNFLRQNESSLDGELHKLYCVNACVILHICLHMYVCMYICMYVHAYICTDVRSYGT